MDYASILKHTLPAGVLDVSIEYAVAKLLGILLVIVLSELAKRFTLSSLGRVDDRVTRVGFSGHTKRIVRNLIGYSFNFVAILLILWILNLLPLAYTLLTAAGFVGIVIGFGMRDISSNFLSGLIISIEQPYRISDTVEVSSYRGSVENISMRMTTLKLTDGRIVYIPNANILNTTIINYTQSIQRRVEIPVEVSYESDLTVAIKTIKETLDRNKNVLKNPGPFVMVDSFKDSGILVKAFYWLDTQKSNYADTKNSVTTEIQGALKEKGIEIPYPKMEVIEKKSA